MVGWQLRKFPRTPHLEGSRLGFGDDTNTVRFSTLSGTTLLVEEKVDGANTAVSCDSQGRIRLQSRGHELSGGHREGQFDLFKQWANAKAALFADVLGDRYVAYGEWCFAKHSMFYDALPHFWLEFDVLDKTTFEFLDTTRRRKLWEGTGIVSVPVLAVGKFAKIGDLTATVTDSAFMSPEWRRSLAEAAIEAGCVPADVEGHTDLSGRAEGIYVKSEQDGVVVGRYKWVRSGFNQTISDSGTHWADRPIVANRLAPSATIWS